MQRCLFTKQLELSQRRGVVPWSVDLEVIYIEIIIEFLASQGKPVIKKKKKKCGDGKIVGKAKFRGPRITRRVT